MTQAGNMIWAGLLSRTIATGLMLLTLCAASLAQANTLEEAKQKLSQKDYAAAHAIYLSLANQNDAKACYNLGLMSQNGDGVAKSMDEAVKWYTKSADLNYKEAQYTLGSLVFQRMIQSISYPQAVAYYAQAATQGHVKSQLNLGMLYLRGEVIAQDMPAAVKWLSLAASHNNSEAQGYLGELYQQGAGVEQNTVKAAMWLMLATQNEDKRFIHRHTKMLSYLSAQMTEAQKTSATQLAAQCKSQQLQGC
ncbi:tetratricopeptide repeat protein [Methylophilus aquaticus]|uniref:Tetratricopeptide repeat protein n=1 Tax=Methylophilus aquaticus TaxID=1971610 RepID=A0ABT9JWU1_9PROT|nr:tetratricopeptide repeat protein [Methylophilus aquaticus]MDP8568910.1 tetratricopeptide repeat protein [Methylophilus aquaticus]